MYCRPPGSLMSSTPSTSGATHQYPTVCSHGSRRLRCHSASGNQVYRFKHQFQPDRTQQPSDTWLSWPSEGDPALTNRIGVADEDTRIDPEQELWHSSGPAGSISLQNPYAQHFRLKKVHVPVPMSLPGSDYWHVEALNDYSRNWPSLKIVGGKLQFRKGFLEPVYDPKVVPFFFYRGLEQITYSWTDRAFQLLFTAVYAGVHLALLNYIWANNTSLAIAVGLNWGLGRLSLGKWAVLLFLADVGRLWIYFAYLIGKVIDQGLKKLFPPVRRFFWAMFTVWALYVVLSPLHYYPLPFWPFAPGSLGVQEALG